MELCKAEFHRLWDAEVVLFRAPTGVGLRWGCVASDRPPANLVRRLSTAYPRLTFTLVFTALDGSASGFGVCADGRWLAGEQLLPERWDLNELTDPPPARLPH